MRGEDGEGEKFLDKLILIAYKAIVCQENFISLRTSLDALIHSRKFAAQCTPRNIPNSLGRAVYDLGRSLCPVPESAVRKRRKHASR